MLYNFNATGPNSIKPGLKKFIVDAGLESILIPGTSITIISGPYLMYGNVVSYDQIKLIIDVEKTNTKEKDNLFSDTWNIEVEGEFKKTIPKETPTYEQLKKMYPDYYRSQVATQNFYNEPDPDVKIERNLRTMYQSNPKEIPISPETPYTPPVTPYTPPVTPYTPPVTPVTPYTPPVTPYTPPVTPFTPSGGIATYEEPFYIRYKIPILVLLVALIIGLIYFFVTKNGTYSAKNFISAFGDIL